MESRSLPSLSSSDSEDALPPGYTEWTNRDRGAAAQLPATAQLSPPHGKTTFVRRRESSSDSDASRSENQDEAKETCARPKKIKYQKVKDDNIVQATPT